MRNFSLERLENLFKKHPQAFWRHDVDFSLDAALEMAKFEAERGVKATYYLFLNDDNPFYSLHDALRAEKELYELGHDIGVHIDERNLPENPDFWLLRGKISFHCPTKKVLWKYFDQFKNAYGPVWEENYYADSNGEFRYGDPEDHHFYNADLWDVLQINLHPEWWFEKGWYQDISDDVYRAFFYCEKPNFVDSRRGRPVRNGEADIWAFDPRPWATTCALWVSPDQWNFVFERGYAIIDGQKAVPQLDSCDEKLGFLRLQFVDGPYKIPEGHREQPDVWRPTS